MDEDIHGEAIRQFNICNACRYCEGYCAVWDDIENKNFFDNSDIDHFANLCHDCRECYNVCPFTEPHEFNLNIPMVLSKVRHETYINNIKPEFMEKPAKHQYYLWSFVIALSILSVFTLGYMNMNGYMLNRYGLSDITHIFPVLQFKIFSTILYIYVIILWALEGNNYWKSINSGKNKKKVRIHNILLALSDSFGHKYFKGGGAGCNYPEDNSGKFRLIFHPMIFFGFIIDLIAIAFYGNLNIYIIIIYMVGSLLISIGSIALLFAKFYSNKKLASKQLLTMDYPFTIIMLLTGITGLIFPVFSGYSIFSITFMIHIALISAIFLMAPFGKFIHPVFRFLSLIKYNS
jgi:citrate/tricarballylate utilization protein